MSSQSGCGRQRIGRLCGSSRSPDMGSWKIGNVHGPRASMTTWSSRWTCQRSSVRLPDLRSARPSAITQTTVRLLDNLPHPVGHQACSHRAQEPRTIRLLLEGPKCARDADRVLGVDSPCGTRQMCTDHGKHHSAGEQAENSQSVQDRSESCPREINPAVLLPGYCAITLEQAEKRYADSYGADDVTSERHSECSANPLLLGSLTVRSVPHAKEDSHGLDHEDAVQYAAQQMSESGNPTGASVALATVLRVTNRDQQLPGHERRQAERNGGQEQVPRSCEAELNQDALGSIRAP